MVSQRCGLVKTIEEAEFYSSCNLGKSFKTVFYYGIILALDKNLFSEFSVEHQPRAIYAWVSNTERSSYYSLSVEGHTFYRLNYPLRLNRWYHTCQSWNGRTGEWQIWVNAERVGRGFHNRVCTTITKYCLFSIVDALLLVSE